MNVIDMFKLTGKTVLITGGYGYLGKSFSIAAAEAGAEVIVGGRSLDKFNTAFKDINISNLNFEKLDVASSESIESCFNSVADKFGKIDVLINTAFYLKGSSPEYMTDEEWELGIDGTLNSVFRCIRGIIPYMKEKKCGNIINISSMYGVVSPDFSVYKDNPNFANPPHYGAAKAAVVQLTKYYAVYLAGYNIRVNCISPGAFPSGTVQKSESFINALKSKIPQNQIGHPDYLKGIVVFLSSDASKYITGQNILVDGGWTAW